MTHTLRRKTRAAVHLFVALALASAPAALPAQTPGTTGRVSGTVTNETGQPLDGAQVTVVNTRQGAVTTADGRFTILGVAPGAVQLRAQRIGYAPATQTVTVVPDQVVTANFALQTQTITLNTVVSVGYTNQETRDISGAVSSVTDEALEDRKVATVQEALRGRIAGVQIVSSGEPGELSRVVIRGQNFLQSSEPLYVVDGLYLRQNPNIDPDDVASIQVLKDASAAAQYGAQAANGVIVITTKRGRAGDTKVGLRSYYGMQTVAKTIDMMGTDEWADVAADAYINAGKPVPLGIIAAQNGEIDVSTDWQDAIFRSGTIQDHNIQASGGSGAASYLVSGGYFQQEGTVLGSGFERYNGRINSEMRRGGRFTFGENLSLSRSNRKVPVGNQIIDALRFPPAIPVYDPTAPVGYGVGTDPIPTFGVNPVGAAELRQQDDLVNQVFGTFYGEAGLFQNLRYRLNLGVNYQDFTFTQFTQRGYPVRQNETINPAALLDQRDNRSQLLMEHLLTLDQTFGEVHEINAVAGYTAQREDYTRVSAGRQGFPDPRLTELNAGIANQSNAGFLNDARLESFLGRVNYTLMDRYLFTGSVRRDGSSRFGPNNRYGTFGSASVGWVVSEEDFFAGSPLAGPFGFLKLRASWGTLGNQDFDDYQYTPSIVSGGFGLGGTGYPLGPGQVVVPGSIQRSLSNPDIRWQENTQSNIGVDASVLGERLTLTADFYVSKSEGLLVRAPLPPSLGSYEAPFVNAGAVRNRGLELGAEFQAYEREDFDLGISANVTTVRNEVLSLGNGTQPIYVDVEGFNVTRTAPGDPIGTFWVRDMIGIFQNQAEIDAHGAQPGAQPGDVKYRDINDDGQINDADRYNAGSGIPSLEGGLFFDGRFRRFDFTVGLRGSYGAEILNVARWWTDRLDDPTNYRADLNPWTPDNPSNTTPRAVKEGPSAGNNNRLDSDRFVENGSYLRLQNIQVGYVLPTGLTRMANLTGDSRIYLNFQNLFTLTGYEGYDPEATGIVYNNSLDALLRGVDAGQIYPNQRTVTFGIDLDF